jgi:hypothetical protein
MASAVLTMTGYAAERTCSSKIVLARATEPPELARVTGQAMVGGRKSNLEAVRTKGQESAAPILKPLGHTYWTVAHFDESHKNKLIATRFYPTLDTGLDPCRAPIGEAW